MMKNVQPAALLLLLIALVFVIFEYKGTADTTYSTDVTTKQTSAEDYLVTLEEGMSRELIAAEIGKVLNLDEQKIEQFHHTYRAMQWDTFNEGIEEYFLKNHGISEKEREILLTHSTRFLDREDDILEPLYVPGKYTFSGDETFVEAATALLARTPTNTQAFIEKRIDVERGNELLKYIQSQTEFLPDLVPLPPQDIAVVDEPHRRLLVFTTIYYNKGVGDLELRGDSETTGVAGDFDRKVYQRIQRSDGTYRERRAGTFTWHHEHIHYHFTDFIEYQLTGIDNETNLSGEELLQKSTFCVRDVSRVMLDSLTASTSAKFRICGRERQGVSVGWGDAYFSTYPDQNLDISELPSGTYRLTFTANPANRFDEITKANNTASADILYNKEAGTVEVLQTEPSILPEFEHIHVEQEFN